MARKVTIIPRRSSDNNFETLNTKYQIKMADYNLKLQVVNILLPRPIENDIKRAEIKTIFQNAIKLLCLNELRVFTFFLVVYLMSSKKCKITFKIRLRIVFHRKTHGLFGI